MRTPYGDAVREACLAEDREETAWRIWRLAERELTCEGQKRGTLTHPARERRAANETKVVWRRTCAETRAAWATVRLLRGLEEATKKAAALLAAP